MNRALLNATAVVNTYISVVTAAMEQADHLSSGWPRDIEYA